MSFLTAADPLTARATALQLAALLPHVAAESGLDLLSPYFCDDAGDLPEIVNMEAAARIHAETFGKSDGLPFYFHLIEAMGLVSVPTFYPLEGRDGPWLVGDGIDLWSAPNEITARLVAAAVDVARMDPYVECFLPSVSPSPVSPSPVDSRVLASFRLPFVGGTVAIAHSRTRSASKQRVTRWAASVLSPFVAIAAGWLLGGAVVYGIAQSPYIRCASSYVAPECK